MLGAVVPPGDAEAQQVKVWGEDHRSHRNPPPGRLPPPRPGPLGVRGFIGLALPSFLWWGGVDIQGLSVFTVVLRL